VIKTHHSELEFTIINHIIQDKIYVQNKHTKDLYRMLFIFTCIVRY